MPPNQHAADLASAACGFTLAYSDESVLVLDKPSGLLAVPGRGADKQDCLSSRVQAQHPEALVVHRLDMATSGLMLMARNARAQRELGQAFAERRVHKRYTAIASGDMGSVASSATDDAWNLIDLPIRVDWPRRPLRVIDSLHGKPSQTRWRVDADQGSPVSARTAPATRVLLEPVTGRSHQLRVHLQAIGHPILGDALYADEAVAAAASRLLLHASLLRFEHPDSGEWIAVESAPPF